MCLYLPKSHPGCGSNRSGLTLFELLVVMMILAILVSLVIGLGRHADTMAKRHRAMADLGKWQEALHQYYVHLGEYPRSQYNGNVTNLLLACEAIGGTNVWFGEGTSARLTPLDPWGHAYQYVAVTNSAVTNSAPQSFDLYSFGPEQGNSSDDVRFQP